MGSPKRQIASTLDTALLVFFVLLLLAVGWVVVKVVLGTVLFFGKLAVLAVLVALGIRASVWARSRIRRRPDSRPSNSFQPRRGPGRG